MIRITCINKSGGQHYNQHEAVGYYGWVEDGTNDTGKSDRQTMVNWVKSGGVAYILDTLGNRAYCRILTSFNGTEFLQTYADNVPSDNLLSLRECAL